MFEGNVLPYSFYIDGSVVDIAIRLLGKVMVTNINNRFTLSRIVETEAYDGEKDKACHAYPLRKTMRTEVMFKDGGRSYVYVCYGIHHLMNIITNAENEPHAVLIRAVEPIVGLEAMEEHKKKAGQALLTNGPGKLCRALGITRKHNDVILYDDSSPIWIGETKENLPFEVVQTTRIGVGYAEEDAFLPWRFFIEGNLFVSRG